MPRRIIFKTTLLKYPPRCVVCQARSKDLHTVWRKVPYMNRSVKVSVDVPLCAQHLKAAEERGPRETLVRRAGLSIGIVSGLLTTYLLLRSWTVPGQGISVLNLFVAAFVGASLLMLIWSAANFFFGPLLAGPEVVAARYAVRILRYWPRSGQIQLLFENEAAADAVVEANRDMVVLVQ